MRALLLVAAAGTATAQVPANIGYLTKLTAAAANEGAVCLE